MRRAFAIIGRDGMCVLLAYVIIALVDGLGVLSSYTGLVGVSSVLFFLWFAVLPIPTGMLCNRAGCVQVLRVALAVSALACALLCAGAWSKTASVAGFCLAGLANVSLQVAVPIWVAERFSPARLAGVATAGLFARTAVAMSFPFLVCTLAGWGCWWLSLAPFFVVSLVLFLVVDGAFFGSRDNRAPQIPACRFFRRVLADPVVCCSALAFAIAVMADVAFNLSVPELVSRRFGGAGKSVGAVYAVWFGVKLPLMLVGSCLFLRYEARRFFAGSACVSLVGAVVMLTCAGWWAYLVGVGLFAAGFANVYGYVFGAAAPRHPDAASAVSAVLVMSIAAGALASPLLAGVMELGRRGPEGLVLTLVAVLLPLAAYLSTFRNKT